MSSAEMRSCKRMRRPDSQASEGRRVLGTATFFEDLHGSGQLLLVSHGGYSLPPGERGFSH